MSRGATANTNYIVFGLTRSDPLHTIDRNLSETILQYRCSLGLATYLYIYIHCVAYYYSYFSIDSLKEIRNIINKKREGQVSNFFPPHFCCACLTPGPGFPISHIVVFLCSVSSVKIRGDWLFCWYWWNSWQLLFKLSFHIKKVAIFVISIEICDRYPVPS